MPDSGIHGNRVKRAFNHGGNCDAEMSSGKVAAWQSSLFVTSLKIIPQDGWTPEVTRGRTGGSKGRCMAAVKPACDRDIE